MMRPKKEVSQCIWSSGNSEVLRSQHLVAFSSIDGLHRLGSVKKFSFILNVLPVHFSGYFWSFFVM